MSLWSGLKQAVQFLGNLQDKVLGKCCELAHLIDTLMQNLQLQ